MNILKALLMGVKPNDMPAGISAEVLPEVDAFVDLALGDGNERRSIPIDAIDDQTITTRSIVGLRPGDRADFLYTNAYGKYRFSTVCSARTGQHAYFQLPVAVKPVDRNIKLGTQIEVRLTLEPAPMQRAIVSEVVRVAKIATSSKMSAGIRFVNLWGENERVVNAFIRERQARRHERGVA